jgi:N-acetylmuramoyl-L-alanine amidase
MAWTRASQGDSISSIASSHGLWWRTVWDHAENADLKTRRGDPNVLKDGDRVFVPDCATKYEFGGTELRHRFKRRGEPEALRLQLLYGGEEQALRPYHLDVEGTSFVGQTDAEGRLEHLIPVTARKARLEVDAEAGTLVFNLQLGHLDPTDEIKGVQARLKNLGFDPGMKEGVADDTTRQAIRAFQQAEELAETAEPDAATKQRLLDKHAS